MLKKLGLLAASIIAAGTLTVALTLAGFAPSTPTQADPAASALPVDSAAADAPFVVDTVYVAAPAEPATITVQAPPTGGDDEGEHEGGDDD